MVMYLSIKTSIKLSISFFFYISLSHRKELRMKENILLLIRNPFEGVSYISIQGINVILESLTVCIVKNNTIWMICYYFVFFSTPDNHRATKLGVYFWFTVGVYQKTGFWCFKMHESHLLKVFLRCVL